MSVMLKRNVSTASEKLRIKVPTLRSTSKSLRTGLISSGVKMETCSTVFTTPSAATSSINSAVIEMYVSFSPVAISVFALMELRSESDKSISTTKPLELSDGTDVMEKAASLDVFVSGRKVRSVDKEPVFIISSNVIVRMPVFMSKSKLSILGGVVSGSNSSTGRASTDKIAAASLPAVSEIVP